MDILSENPLADHYSPAPLSTATLDELDRHARNQSGIRGRMQQCGIDYQRAIAAEHRAQIAGDAEAQSVAILKRAAAAGRIDTEQGHIADDFLSGLSLAIEHRPRELAELCGRLLRPAWNHLQSELAEHAAAIVEGGGA